jgi:hypothetical protein
VKPLGIVPTTLDVYKGTQLEADIKNGIFQMATGKEVLEEQIKTIELINVPTYYMGMHVINSVSFDSHLPKGKQDAIDKIKYVLNTTTESVLNSIPEYHSI